MHYAIGTKSLRTVAPLISPARAQAIAFVMGDAMHAHHITTQRRALYCIAQFAHESCGFQVTREFASGSEYEGWCRSLGNCHPGDGPRFKGRGFIQVTGRANYAALSKALHQDFVGHPALLEGLHWAAQASCYWWEAHGCNQLADAGDFVGLTRRINGGTNGLASRRLYLARARPVARWLTPRPA